MSRRRPVPNPLTPANLPWSRGLRFFTVFDQNLVNYADPGFGEYHNLSANSPLAPTRGTADYPGQTFSATNHDYVTWTQYTGKITGEVTVIARWKPKAGAIGAALGTWQNNFGFSLLFVSGTFGAEDGVEFIVGETGSNLLISSGNHVTYENVEATVGGRYNSSTRTVDIWQNGVKLATNTDVAKAWNTTATTDMASGLILGTSQFFDGDLFWVACFDRCLTDAEMIVWTTQDPLELLVPPDPLLSIPPTVIILSSGGTGTPAISLTGPIFFSLNNAATAYGETGGDLPSVPPTIAFGPANVGIGTSQIELFPPILTTLASSGTGQSVISLTVPYDLASGGLGASSFSTTTGAQANVITGDRYRR